jgi:sec-independent protein translocase protein TatB
MLDLGSWGEFLIIAIAILVLLGPKELPSLLRTIGRWVYKIRQISAQLRRQVEPFLQEGEIQAYMDETKRQVNKEMPIDQPISPEKSPHE